MAQNSRTLRIAGGVLTIVGLALAADTWHEQDCKTEILGDRITLTGKVSKSCFQTEECNGGCGTVQGIPVLKSAACRRFCTDIPGGKKIASVSVFAKEAYADDSKYSACGGADSPGSCGIDWSGYFGNEWYGDKRRFCAKLKNWSDNREREFKVVISLAKE